MHRKPLPAVLLMLLTVAALGLGGCSTTTINGVWKDPHYSGGPLRQVLVVSVAKNDLMRRLYEDAFVAQLQKFGIRATPGYEVLPAGFKGDPQQLKQKLQGHHFEDILVTRLTDKRTIEIQYPGTTYIEHYPDRRLFYRDYPYYRHWEDYYDHSYAVIQSMPPYTTRTQLVVLQTNLYNARDEIIFSVRTETLVDYGAAKTIDDIVSAVIKAMRDKQLL